MEEEKKVEKVETVAVATEEVETGAVAVGSIASNDGITEEDKKLDVEADARNLPVIQRIFADIAGIASLPTGIIAGSDVQKKLEAYIPIVERALDEMVVRGVKYEEVSHIVAGLDDVVGNIKELLLNSVKGSAKRAQGKLFGVKFEDITLADIDRVLKAD